MRAIELPSGKKAILSDTVGFISDLPTQLVAAFRATLEEVQGAEVILHVRDIAQPDTEAERADVIGILRDLGIEHDGDPRVIEVLNKTDALDEEARMALNTRAARSDNMAPVSAVTGEGLERLLQLIDARLGGNRKIVAIELDAADGKAQAWLHRRGEVLEQKAKDDRIRLKVRLEPEDCARFEAQFPAYKIKMMKAK
jgi:GTPase